MQGAELVTGDYADFDSLNHALEGVEAAYFVYPVAAGIAEAAGLFVGAAKSQGVSRIVDLSLGSTSPNSLSPQVRAQWVAEQIFEANGMDGVHLRMKCFFLENPCCSWTRLASVSSIASPTLGATRRSAGSPEETSGRWLRRRERICITLGFSP